ncbi:penicillin-binding protein [Altererythrobacter soli]|uniref:Penicillin-binding protein n=1 Tax=Croceibacterium soli TaxID=1739690 RepID=A0A6I4V0N5_9SPHN|nr:transglycosylase domain-containing protein [Croceibacterium soli]MXP42555.1 penicillin-binding protein [Croceibacterium soli]
MLRDPHLRPDSDEALGLEDTAAEPSLAYAPGPPPPGRWITRERLKWTGLGIVGAFLALILVLVITAPLSKSLQPITAPSLTLLSAEGAPIARRGAVVEGPVDAAELPDHVVQPFLAIEDRRFFGHFGVDPQGLARAFLANLREGEVVEGGSTITQQLAKLSFLSPEQTIWRKLQEAVLAFWLEARLGKNEILSRYLSSVYFGDNVFGLRAAARHYFSREPEELSVEQAAMLAGLLKAPSTLAPTDNLDGARERAAVVIAAMVDAGMLSKAEAEELPEVTLDVGGLPEVPSGSYFADWAFAQAEAALDDKYPAHTLTTTLEDRLQREAVAAIRNVGTGGAQVALVAMRRDGRVVAMVGGNSYERSPFNRATQALRQPGSTFKLFVYLAALREGYTPGTRVEDRPLRIGNWTPANYNDEYRGEITLREAFAVSSNVAAVRLAEEVGRDKVIAAARDLGMRGELERGPTMALGTSGVSLIDLVAAYAAVSAGRHPVRPHGLPRENVADGTTAMEPRVRAQMLELLRAAVNEGSARGARLSTQAFGKTGTSQDSRDAYFIGFSGDLITGVWIGHDDNRPMPGAQGGGVPAAIWRNFMTRALTPADEAPAPARAPREMPPPPSAARAPVVSREYDVEQGLAGEDAPIARPLDGPTAQVPIVAVPPVVDLPGPAAPRIEPRPAPAIPTPDEELPQDAEPVEAQR